MSNLFFKGWTRLLWGIAAGAVLLAVFGAAVMLLWNALLPGIAGWPAIGYLQAVGILALARILVGRPGGWDRHHIRGGNAFREKWMKMTPEEQEEFIRKQTHYHHLFSGPRRETGRPNEHAGTRPSPDRGQDTE
jgi:hypothetical protein